MIMEKKANSISVEFGNKQFEAFVCMDGVLTMYPYSNNSYLFRRKSSPTSNYNFFSFEVLIQSQCSLEFLEEGK